MVTGMLNAADAPEFRQGEQRIEILKSEVTPEQEQTSQEEYATEEKTTSEELATEEEVRETSDISYLNRFYPVSQPALSIGNGAIEFPDHSVWQISPDDAYKINKWQANSDLLVITQNFSWFWTPTFKFLIHNESKNSYVEANIILAPYLSHAAMIVSVDQANRCIRLTDGTVWSISSRDDYIYYDRTGGLAQRRWIPGDQIIVGVNSETFGSVNRPFILINVTVDGKYAHAEKIY